MTRKPVTPDRIYRRARLLLILGTATIAAGFTTLFLGYEWAHLLVFLAWALVTLFSWNIGWLKGFRNARTGQQ